MKLLKDNVSVITGSNNGIGLSILSKFSENSSKIFACYRNMNDKFEENVYDYPIKRKMVSWNLRFSTNQIGFVGTF